MKHVILILCIVGLNASQFIDDEKIGNAVTKFIGKSKEIAIEGLKNNAATIERFAEKYEDAKNSDKPDELEKFNIEFMEYFAKKYDMTTISSMVCKARFADDAECDSWIVSGNRDFDPRPVAEYKIWSDKVDKEIKKQLKHESL